MIVRWNNRCSAFVLACFVAQASFGAEPAIELTGVADPAVLPVAKGADAVIRVAFADGKPKAVWLASDKESKLRVVLTVADDNRYQVDLADPDVVALLNSRRSAGQFQVFAEMQDGRIVDSDAIRFSFAPTSGDADGLQENGKLLTLPQRTTKRTTFAGEPLTLTIDDITAGQVRLTLRTAEGQVLIDGNSLRQGASEPFELHGREYVLIVKKLVNILIGEDWAEIELSPLTAEELREIEALLDRVSKARETFIREGRRYNGREAAAHLRRKFKSGPQVRTRAEFIEKIASRSSISGQPYLVMLGDGSTVEAQAWLTARATELDAAQQDDSPAVEPTPDASEGDSSRQ